jgi:hypothetical protein
MTNGNEIGVVDIACSNLSDSDLKQILSKELQHCSHTDGITSPHSAHTLKLRSRNIGAQGIKVMAEFLETND